MEFRLLGPLEVLLAGQPAEIRAPRQEIVLAVLLLEANRVVPVSKLVEALWDDNPPATAKGQVQIAVSALRRLLADSGDGGAIATRSPGYLIRLPDDALDLRRFESLTAGGAAAAAQARLEEAAQKLRAALALWRGQAAAGIDSRVVQAAAVRLNESRLAVWEDCIDLELRLGLHHGLIAELTELVAGHPLRERLRGQLMLALYRSGRQAEALEVFRDARSVLNEELGLDPGAELQALERAILAGDPALGPPQRTAALEPPRAAEAPVPRQLPATIAEFSGREDVLGAMSRLLSPGEADDERRHVSVVMLTGKGGVGKTTLAVRAAHLLAGSFPDGQLYAQLSDQQGQPKNAMMLLEAFLRSLGADPSALPRGLAERAAAYRSRIAQRRVLIVLDDAVSLDQVRPLLPGSPSCAVIITSRRRFSGLEGAHQFEIEALDEQPAMDLVARLIGAERVCADLPSLRELVTLCGGLPLALRIAAAKLSARPHWRVGDLVRRLEDESRRLDELDLDGVSISSTLALSYKNLEESGRVLLRRLSMLGAADFASWVCAPLLAADADAAENVLEHLVESWLVETRAAADGSVRFQLHDLVRVYAAERLVHEESGSERAASLRRLLGCWLSVAAEAHRRVYGGDYRILHGPAGHGTQTGWLSRARVDAIVRDPMKWFQGERPGLVAAIMLACRADLDELAWDLATTAVTVFEAGCYADDWSQTHHAALAAVRKAGNLRGEAALLHSLGNLALTTGMDDAERDFERSSRLFMRLGDVHGQALSLDGLATVDRLRGRYESALATYEQALAGFQDAGDLIGAAHVLSQLAQIHTCRREYDVAVKLLDDALSAGTKAGARRVIASVQRRMGELHLLDGHPDRAEELFRSAWRGACEDGDIIGQGYALLGLGVTAQQLGDLGQAGQHLRAAAELADCGSDYLLRGRILLALAELDLTRDRTEQALANCVQAVAMLSHLGSATFWQARAMELTGRLHKRAGRTGAAAHAFRTALELSGSTGTILADKLSRSLARLHADPDEPPRWYENARRSALGPSPNISDLS